MDYHLRSAQVWHVFSRDLSFTCTPTCSFAMSHTCLCLPSYSWYSFTDPGRMEGWVSLRVYLHEDSLPAWRPSPIPQLTGLNVEQLCWSKPTHLPLHETDNVEVCLSVHLPMCQDELYNAKSCMQLSMKFSVSIVNQIGTKRSPRVIQMTAWIWKNLNFPEFWTIS